MRFLACCVGLAAVASASFGQRFQARLFDQQDGLGNPTVTAIAQDSAGYLWIGTQNGLFRYDGAFFREYGRDAGFRVPSFTSLLADHSGTLWVGTHNGLFYFDGRQFHEVQYQGQSVHVGLNSMLAASSAGELIAMTSHGPLSIRRDGSDWAAIPYSHGHPGFPQTADMNGIGFDASDNLWFGLEEGLAEYGPHGLRILGPAEGVPPDYYVSLFRARDGQMWARGRKHIVEWSSTSGRARDLTGEFPPGAMNTLHRRFAEDSFGNILTPSASGFATWNGSAWSDTPSTSKGPIDGATALFADREGSVWIGTATSGLLQSLGYRRWRNYGAAEGLGSGEVSAIAKDRGGQVWFGHEQGLNLLSTDTRTVLPSPLPVQTGAGAVASFAPSPDGGMWVAFSLGLLLHLDAGRRVDTRIDLDTYINRIRVDSRGALWIATSSGMLIARCSGHAECSPQPLLATGLPKTQFSDFIFDSQPGNQPGRPGEEAAVWAVGERGLTYIRDGAAASVPVAGQPRSQTQTFALIAQAPDGTLWLSGASPGIERVRVTGATAAIVESHARPDLASDYVEFLDSDPQGRLWIGTDHGVNILSKGALYRITDEDGLIWNDTDGMAFMAASDGSVWIGTGKGVSHLLDPIAILSRSPFAAAIDQVRYDLKPMDAPLAGPSTNQFAARWTGGTTFLSFSGLTFRDNRSLIYHYRLEGFDSKQIATATAFVRYQKLPPGRYTFHVIAEDTVHRVFSAPAEVRFTLTPPWWRTYTFYTVAMLAGCLLFALGWRWSNRVLLTQRHKLQRLVDERTADLQLLATRDGLTGLLNRAAILAALQTEYEYAREHDAAVCVALIDLDHFKRINDTLGHYAGDEVLRQSALRLSSSIRATDALGRYGGEEFLIVLRNVQDEVALHRCEVIRQTLCELPIHYEGQDLSITCSIGVAWSRSKDDLVSKIIASADSAMYAAKANGRNRVEYAIAG